MATRSKQHPRRPRDLYPLHLSARVQLLRLLFETVSTGFNSTEVASIALAYIDQERNSNILDELQRSPTSRSAIEQCRQIFGNSHKQAYLKIIRAQPGWHEFPECLPEDFRKTRRNGVSKDFGELDLGVWSRLAKLATLSEAVSWLQTAMPTRGRPSKKTILQCLEEIEASKTGDAVAIDGDGRSTNSLDDGVRTLMMNITRKRVHLQSGGPSSSMSTSLATRHISVSHRTRRMSTLFDRGDGGGSPPTIHFEMQRNCDTPGIDEQKVDVANTLVELNRSTSKFATTNAVEEYRDREHNCSSRYSSSVSLHYAMQCI